MEEEIKRIQRRAQDPKDKLKKHIKLKGMDPIQDGDIRKRRKPRRLDGEDSDDYQSSEEEENQTFMQKLGGFLFFGCGGTSKR